MLTIGSEDGKRLDLVKHALGVATETANFHIRRHWVVPEPVLVWHPADPTKPGSVGENRQMVDEKTGEPVFREATYVEYVQQRAGANNFGEAKVTELLSIDQSLPSDDRGRQIAEARAREVIAYFEGVRGQGAVPEGHMALAAWSGLRQGLMPILQHYGFHSVDMMANATEADLARMPGGVQPHKLRDEARAVLHRYRSEAVTGATAQNSARVSELERELAEMKTMMARLLNTKLAEAGVNTNEQPAAGAPAPSNAPRREKAAA